MIAARGLTIAELDSRASEAEKPYAVITADCSGAREFDDAISVTPLPMEDELYRVNVFSVDTSKLYLDESITRRAMTLTESRYGGDKDYRPMLDKDLTQSLHFAEGTIRKALCVSFVVGLDTPPSEPTVSFGRVEVTRNLRYNTFGAKCRYSPNFKNYGRASALIMRHLKLDARTDEEINPAFEDIYNNVIHVPRAETWKRGASINQAFMIAANHLVGKAASEAGDLIIYRAHDTTSDHLLEVLSPIVARYTLDPAPHDGLRLEDPYARVTSPLRRLEDFVNVGILALRHKKLTVGKPAVGPRDIKIATASVQRLNQRTAAEQFAGPLMMGRHDQKPSPKRLSGNTEPFAQIA